mmetsp:Transcript_50716/g.130820  ORF Transcript_50716/g.130820 Transcript_50716/m.130820 type:complete len:200 (-) Transcript_50716:163-762(-)
MSFVAARAGSKGEAGGDWRVAHIPLFSLLPTPPAPPAPPLAPASAERGADGARGGRALCDEPSSPAPTDVGRSTPPSTLFLFFRTSALDDRLLLRLCFANPASTAAGLSDDSTAIWSVAISPSAARGREPDEDALFTPFDSPFMRFSIIENRGAGGRETPPPHFAALSLFPPHHIHTHIRAPTPRLSPSLADTSHVKPG